ncbi:MAG: DUF3307 domain-containing protein [Mangrovibacterium sp.]
MIFKLILLQFLAHLLADFIFQPQAWSNGKCRRPFTSHHVWHGLVVFACSWLLSFDLHYLFAALVLTVIHFFTDVLKSFLVIRSKVKGTNKNYFFTDQFIHLFFLVIIPVWYGQTQGIRFVADLPLQPIAVITAFVFCSKPANIFIKNILTVFSIAIPTQEHPFVVKHEDQNTERSLPNAGKLIGIMERLLTLALILVGQYGAVGLIIAAKSILRFKDTQMNEYILVGTLLSFSFAVLPGILIAVFIS